MLPEHVCLLDPGPDQVDSTHQLFSGKLARKMFPYPQTRMQAPVRLKSIATSVLNFQYSRSLYYKDTQYLLNCYLLFGVRGKFIEGGFRIKAAVYINHFPGFLSRSLSSSKFHFNAPNMCETIVIISTFMAADFLCLIHRITFEDCPYVHLCYFSLLGPDFFEDERRNLPTTTKVRYTSMVTIFLCKN